MADSAEGKHLRGSHRVRVIRPALRKANKMLPKCRDQMELRAQALKLRHWPEKEVIDEQRQLIDLDWSWIKALSGLRIGELRIADEIGGHENIRLIFWVGDKAVRAPLPMIWVLDVLAKKRDEFTSYQLDVFRAKRTLILERFYKARDN
jgi:hypothetical protein